MENTFYNGQVRIDVSDVRFKEGYSGNERDGAEFAVAKVDVEP